MLHEEIAFEDSGGGRCKRGWGDRSSSKKDSTGEQASVRTAKVTFGTSTHLLKSCATLRGLMPILATATDRGGASAPRIRSPYCRHSRVTGSCENSGEPSRTQIHERPSQRPPLSFLHDRRVSFLWHPIGMP